MRSSLIIDVELGTLPIGNDEQKAICSPNGLTDQVLGAWDLLRGCDESQALPLRRKTQLIVCLETWKLTCSE